jgi:hypothetical protein
MESTSFCGSARMAGSCKLQRIWGKSVIDPGIGSRSGCRKVRRHVKILASTARRFALSSRSARRSIGDGRFSFRRDRWSAVGAWVMCELQGNRPAGRFTPETGRLTNEGCPSEGVSPIPTGPAPAPFRGNWDTCELHVGMWTTDGPVRKLPDVNSGPLGKPIRS